MLLSINTICNFTFLATPRVIEGSAVREQLIAENSKNPLTHYMICESDRLRIPKESVTNTALKITFTVRQQISVFDWDEHQIEMPALIQGRQCQLVVDDSIVSLVSEDGKKLWFDNTFQFLETLALILGGPQSLSELLKLTVMYVGQTEISKKYIRFDGHEKLNSVFGEVVDLRPHREVWIKMLSFQKPFINMLVIPGIDSPYRHDSLFSQDRVNSIPKEQLNNLIEGVLIKYFQPQFNIQLKNNFPSKEHTSYNYFYQQGMRSVIVELHEELRAYATGNQDTPYTKIKYIEYALSLTSDDNGVFLHDNARQDLDEIVLSGRP